MRLLKISAFVLTAALVLNACKKKKDDSPTGGTSKKDILMSHSWVGTDILINDTSVWTLGIIPACSKDDIYTFKANNVVTTDEGATKCNSSDPQSSDDVWMLIENDTKIVNGGDTMVIAELSSGKARFTMMDGSDKFEIRMGPKP